MCPSAMQTIYASERRLRILQHRLYGGGELGDGHRVQLAVEIGEERVQVAAQCLHVHLVEAPRKVWALSMIWLVRLGAEGTYTYFGFQSKGRGGYAAD